MLSMVHVRLSTPCVCKKILGSAGCVDVICTDRANVDLASPSATVEHEHVPKTKGGAYLHAGLLNDERLVLSMRN